MKIQNFPETYSIKLFIAFKMAYFCCFVFGGNLDFLNPPQKSRFITLATGEDQRVPKLPFVNVNIYILN